MKNFISTALFIAAVFLALQNDIHAQYCGTIPCDTTDVFNNMESAISGGLYKPAQNQAGEYYRILVGFIRFQNDSSVVNNWNLDSLPNWAYNLVDSVTSTNYHSYSLSDYFYRMSKGKFDFIGDVFPRLIVLPKDTSFGLTNYQAIDTMNKYIANFKRYDNWKIENDSFVFNAENGEGEFDLLILIYRKGSNMNLTGGIATLATSYVTHDSIYISSGSGITTNNRGFPQNAFSMTQHLAHEYGHYLFGGGHTAVSGIMPGAPYDYYGCTYAMSAWEREKLGYISIPVADDNQTETLQDYVTTGEALKVYWFSGKRTTGFTE
jgi:hypothetical protein